VFSGGIMKKLLVPILILTLAFFLVSCEDDDVKQEEVNPFIGTWGPPGMDSIRLVFTENVGTLYNPLDRLNWTGTYSYNESTITVILDKEKTLPIVIDTYGDKVTRTYKFKDDILIFGDAEYKKVTAN
jgi:uncharacterized lipoprotein YehR (DUF1307 family)